MSSLIDAQRRGNGSTPINDNVLPTSFYQPKHPNNTTRQRITQVHGSMLACDLVQLQREQLEKAAAAASAKDDYQNELRAAYEKCKAGCTCTGAACEAKGYFLCLSCVPLVGIMKKHICQVRKCIEARAVTNALWDPPLPNKASARKRQKADNSRPSRIRKEVSSSEYAESEGDVATGGHEDGGRVSDVPDLSEGSDGDSESSGSSHDSDNDLLLHDTLLAKEKSVHFKGYAWEVGRFYKVWWRDVSKWLWGQYVKGSNTGVTLYYEADDTVATHLYVDDWHIRDCVRVINSPDKCPNELGESLIN